MLPNWNLMRIYGSSGFAETLLDLIRDKDLDMKVMLGVWIGPDSAEANRREVEYAIGLATDYPEIVLAASVGNETQVYWSAHRCSLDLLVYHVRHLRSRISIPVTVADDFNFWNKPESRRLASEIDFITMHAHPMWNGIELEEALNWLEERLSDVQAMHPEHHLVLGETGWATSVHDECEQAKLIKGKPGEIEQKFFYDAVLRLAATHNLTVFFFEAFDENWKGGLQADEVEKHWGLFRANRTAKMVMAPTVLQ